MAKVIRFWVVADDGNVHRGTIDRGQSQADPDEKMVEDMRRTFELDGFKVMRMSLVDVE
jgi:hypothetical protein